MSAILVSSAGSFEARTAGTLSPQSKELTLSAEKLIETLSYSHFELLAAIDSLQKRTFYQTESVRGTWSVRELKRQIASRYYERSGLSRDKKKLAALVDAKVEHSTPALTIRDPYVFEFLGIHPQEVMPESRLAPNALEGLSANRLQDIQRKPGPRRAKRAARQMRGG